MNPGQVEKLVEAMKALYAPEMTDADRADGSRGSEGSGMTT